MNEDNSCFFRLVDQLQSLPQIEAIALGGSRASGVFDEASDYDLYLYVREMPEVSTRRQILEPLCSRMELGNTFWEMEDDCTFSDGIDIDILYRNLDDFADGVRRTVFQAQPGNAYTTCMWFNLLHSRILFDRNGRLGALQKELDIPYPQALASAIIERAGRLLTGSLASYDRQIRKAVKRMDRPAMNHRTAAFAESCFDLLYALNKLAHPGEKRMMESLKKDGCLLPDHFEEDLNALLNIQAEPDAALAAMDSLLTSLSALLVREGYPPLL